MVKRIKLRTLLIGGLITLFFVVLIGRVFWIQVVNGNFWQKTAEDTWSHLKEIPAKRGTITDRNGDVLAIDAPAYTVAVNPKIIHSNNLENEVVQKLHELLGKPEDELRALVTAKKNTGEFYAQREVRNEGWKIDQDLADKVTALIDEMKDEHKFKDASDVGITLIKEERRYYPKNNLASHILGYTDREGNAVAGIEALYDSQLKGTPGSIYYESDNKGYKLPSAKEVYKPARDGKNLKLTIDSTIQYYIQEAMKEAYAKYQPISMTVIAADPKTMEILGLANMPDFNPNDYWDTAEQKDFYNHAVRSTYEPGSTFKIVTLAGAVQEGLFNPNATFMSGSITIKGSTIHDVKRGGWGEITYLDGVKRSSNVGFVHLGYEMLGEERLRKYIDNFGFGQKTGIDLPGEATGQVSFHYPIEVATAAYGHGKLTVTPIQQVAAVAAVANGGKLLVPHVVKEITDPTTGKTVKVGVKEVRRVLTPEKAKEVSGYLEQVVADQEIGTGRHAYIEGYRVAGKTGTAVKVVNGKYDYTKQVVSFIGYAPVEDPKIVVLVLIDEPKDSALGGGTAAAPVFKKIVSQTLQYMGVPKTVNANPSSKGSNVDMEQKMTVPNLKDMTTSNARTKLMNEGIAFETLGSGSTVIAQYPKEGTTMTSSQRIYLLTEQSDNMKIPNLTGSSLRDALEVLTLMKVSVSVSGEGFVVNQEESMKNGNRYVKLTLRPVAEGVKATEGGNATEAEKPSSDQGTVQTDKGQE
ncbi:penicillin-binding transpeptidase domain-containing protein [Paenibacillus sediminis]|uniref:Penicillin-binding protein 2B n=1 Tax=Paenibacillus sediminis TaxID=664909 RepID=A0ABS4GYV6_9BACL|nr:penicillin-binding transpeptidase domain-containing protein [Paenibacillus sediminis]MBP1935448.1 penicillin-binding protein 2B [Paenibacillus sediminis]